jgi:hypothetical protein
MRNLFHCGDAEVAEYGKTLWVKNFTKSLLRTPNKNPFHHQDTTRQPFWLRA